MTLEDIPAVLAIECASFPLPWTKEVFQRELTYHRATYLVMLNHNRIIGYAGIWTVLDEAHMMNIAVHPAYRGRKLGTRLLRELVRHCIEQGIRNMTLEVRISNAVAQRLYEKFGFISQGVRKNYYEDNDEDALIMWADLIIDREI